MNAPHLKSSTARFLQILIVFFGLGVLTFILWEPHLEGRNAHATPFEIYFHDPFIAYIYLGSLPFFLALYHAFALLGHVRRHGRFSAATLRSLRAIKRCALTLIAFVAGAALIILLVGDGEDRPAGLFMTLLAILPALALVVIATRLSQSLQRTLTHP